MLQWLYICVASVCFIFFSDVGCKCVYMDVCICFTYMLQVFYLDVYVCLQWFSIVFLFACVLDARFECFICLMLHMRCTWARVTHAR